MPRKNWDCKLEDIILRLEEKKLQREIALTEAVEERRMAYETAKSKERFPWVVSGGLLTSALSVYSSLHHKNVMHLLPVIPIFVYLGYQLHECYGPMTQKVRARAMDLLEEKESQMIRPISLEEVRRRREEMVSASKASGGKLSDVW